MGAKVAYSTKRRGFGEHRIVWLRFSDLKLNPRNARLHPEAQVEQIARSIERFGFANPILADGQNNVLAGEGRVKAAQRLKLDRVVCTENSNSDVVMVKAAEDGV